MSPTKKKPTLWERIKSNPITTILGIVVCAIATWFLLEIKPILLTASADRLAIIIGVVVFVYGIGIALMLSPDLFVKKFWSKDLSDQKPFKDRPQGN